MALRIRHIAVLLLGLVLVVVVTACGGGPSEADIEVTAEVMAKAMVKATAEAVPTPITTVTPVPPTPTPTPTATPVPPTPTPTPTATPVPPTSTPTPTPTATPVPPTPTPTPVAIRGEFNYSHLNGSSSNYTGCLHLLGHKNASGASLYSDNGSWIGIKSAGWCGRGLNPIMARTVNALAIEIDLERLPDNDVNRCVINVSLKGDGNVSIVNTVLDPDGKTAWVQLQSNVDNPKAALMDRIKEVRDYSINGVCQ